MNVIRLEIKARQAWDMLVDDTQQVEVFRRYEKQGEEKEYLEKEKRLKEMIRNRL